MNPKEGIRYPNPLQLQRLKSQAMIVPPPSWPGLRPLIIPRSDDGFGFTLRQLVVEPPPAKGANGAEVCCETMESFHVSNVKKGSNAELAGLQAGDRIISVDGQSTTGRTFAEVVQQMQSNSGTMQLLVVPKDEDILQLTYQALSAKENQSNSAMGVTGPAWDQTVSATAQPYTPYERRETWAGLPSGMTSTSPTSIRPHAVHGQWNQGHRLPVTSARGQQATEADSASMPAPSAQTASLHMWRHDPLLAQHQQLYSLPASTQQLPISYQAYAPKQSRTTTGARDSARPRSSVVSVVTEDHATEISAPSVSVSAAASANGPSAGLRGMSCAAEQPYALTALRSGERLAPLSNVAAELPGGHAAAAAVPPYQLSAPRLPQQVIRAPARVTERSPGQQVNNSSSHHATASSSHQYPASSGAMQQSNLIRYLPAYDGGGAHPVVHRPARAGATGGQRPVTSAFECGLPYQVQQQPSAMQTSNRWASAVATNTGYDGGNSCWQAQKGAQQPPRYLAVRKSDEWLLQPGPIAGNSARSPVQRETTFNNQGAVEQCYFTFELDQHGLGSHAISDNVPPMATDLNWRVASDNDLRTARPYPRLVASRQDTAQQQQQTHLFGGDSGLQQPAGTKQQLLQQAALKPASSLGCLQQQQPSMASSALPGVQSHAPGFGGMRTAVSQSVVGAPGARDRLPSDAPGMMYNRGFISTSSTSHVTTEGDGNTGATSGAGDWTAARRHYPLSYTANTRYTFAETDHDSIDHSNSLAETLNKEGDLNYRMVSAAGRDVNAQTVQHASRAQTMLNRSQSTEDSTQRAQIIRRTSYMLATTSVPMLDSCPDRLPGRAPLRRPDFLGDLSVSGRPMYEQVVREGDAEAAEDTCPLQPIVQGPHFDLHSPSDGALVTMLPPSPLPITREGNLTVKAEKVDGKKSNDRSWKVLGVVLCGRRLYFIKERKENVVLNQAGEDVSINLRSCRVDVAYGYTKKKNVFRLETASNSEYLFQAEDQEDMMAWIRAILMGSDTDQTNAANNAEAAVRQIEQKLVTQSPVIAANSLKASGSSTAVKRLTTLPFWNRQQSPGSESSTNSKKERKAARLLRGASSPASLSAAGASEDDGVSNGSTRVFGIPLNECPPSLENEFVPRVVEQCTKAVEGCGLEFTGIYRIPGNSVAVGTLQDELNQGVIDTENDRWRDVNVVSSLLKLFFRKLPEPLVTAALYKSFIEASRIEKYTDKIIKIKELIHELPEHNYETFKYLANHLKKVASFGHANKMDAHNLAIVFGPTLLRPSDDSMQTLVADMAGQCSVLETIITNTEWMFMPIGQPPPEPRKDCQFPVAAPISETMQSLADDIARGASKQPDMGHVNKRELITNITSAAARWLKPDKAREKGKAHPAGATASKSMPAGQTSSSSSDSGDHGFAERNIDEEVAARRLRVQEHEAKAKDASGFKAMSPAGVWRHVATPPVDEPRWSRTRQAATLVGSASEDPGLMYSCAANERSGERLVSRWHSEESVLDHHENVRRGPVTTASKLVWLPRPLRMDQGQQQPSMAYDSGQLGAGSTTPSPPPPPLPARRYRSASKENALAGESSCYDTAVHSIPSPISPETVAPHLSAIATPPLLARQDVAAGRAVDMPQLSFRRELPSSAARLVSSAEPTSSAGSTTPPPPRAIQPFAAPLNYQNLFAQSLAAGDVAIDARRTRASLLQGDSVAACAGLQKSASTNSACRAEQRRTSSMDSTLSGSDHSSDLLTAITATFDQKLQKLLLHDNEPDTVIANGVDSGQLASGTDTVGTPHRSAFHLAAQTQGSMPAQVSANPKTHASGSEHSFRDPSLNKATLSARMGAKQDPLQMQGQDQPHTTKIGIASRIERTDMKPQPSAAGTFYNNASAHSRPSDGAADGSSVRASSADRYPRSSSYDSLADEHACSTAKRSGAPDLPSPVGGREGLVKFFVDKFEQKSQPLSSAQRQLSGSISSSSTNLASSGRYSDASISRRRSAADSKKRPRRRHTIGSDPCDDYVDVAAAAAAVLTTGKTLSQQPSAWERLQPAVRQYDGAAPRSVYDWIASERERARGSFPDICSLQAPTADACRRLLSKRLAATLSHEA